MEGGGGLNYVPRYFQERSRFSLLTQTGANRLPQLQSGVDHPGHQNQTIFKYDGKRRRRRRGHGTISEFKASFQPLIYCAIPRKRWLRSRQHLGDTVSTVNRMNQMWHYPGSVDTVSTIMKVQVSTPTNRLIRTVWVLLIGLRSWCGVVFPEGNVLLGYNLVAGVD